MSVTMSEDTATTDINTLRRNLTTPRTGQSPADYARAVHAEEMEQRAKWPERVMLFLAGAFAAAMLIVSMMDAAHAGRRDGRPGPGPGPNVQETAKGEQ